MRKIGIGVFCVALCMSVALMLPHMGISNELVSGAVCLGCHDVGSAGLAGDTVHGNHVSQTDCFICHDGTTEKGTVPSSNCLACHPEDDSANCDLVDFHVANPDYDPTGVGIPSCLTAGCHQTECGGGQTTTTSASTANCPTEEIYGEGSVEVVILRSIRDNVLTKTPEGREIIKLYYLWSPIVTVAIQNDYSLRKGVKELVDEILPFLREEAE